MKIAQHPDTHEPVTAAPEAPAQAVCPHCGGRLTLRQRRRMGGGCSYFWRHLDNEQRRCNGRSRPTRH